MRDFFMLIGTASATLVGLMFVAVSITASYMTEELRPGLSVFLSPTIFHLAAILVICLMVLLPANPATASALVLAAGVLGFAFALRVLLGVERFYRDPEMGIDREDRTFYGFAPVLSQFAIVIASVLLLFRLPAGAWTLVAALMALLLVCIHNAWDITVWAVIRSPNR